MRIWPALASALVPALALAQAGAVDWEHRVVRCGGLGAPSLREAAGVVAVTRGRTERAARSEALRTCMAALGSIVVEGRSTVAQAVEADAGLGASIERVVKRLRSASEPRFFSDGGVSLRVDVPLDGEISELLLAAAARSSHAAASAPAARPGITGVLVDAGALPVVPALAPRILDEKGAVVHAASTLAAPARRGGTAAYAADVPSARSAFAARLGAAPRTVRALRADGADLVVSAADADAIRGAACLAAGRVVVVAGRTLREARGGQAGGGP